jgi:hypothetical protein
MPATAADRPVWAWTASGHVVASPRGLPEDAVCWCREGDDTWTPARVRPPVPPPPARRDGKATLFDGEAA